MGPNTLSYVTKIEILTMVTKVVIVMIKKMVREMEMNMEMVTKIKMGF